DALTADERVVEIFRGEESANLRERRPIGIDPFRFGARLRRIADGFLSAAGRRVPGREAGAPQEGGDLRDVLVDEALGEVLVLCHLDLQVDRFAISSKSSAIASEPRAKFSSENHSSGACAFEPG